MEKNSPHLGPESFPHRAGEQSLPRTVSHSWAGFIISVVSSPQLCYKGFQCIFPEAVEGISHSCVTGMAAHSHDTIKNCFLLNMPITSPQPKFCLNTFLWDQTHSSKAFPRRNTVPLAGRRRGVTAELECPCPHGPVSAPPAAAASAIQEIVENSFSSSSWLRVLKARFFLTLMLMERTSSLKKAASLCCSE